MPPSTESSRGARRSAGENRALERLLTQAKTIQALADLPDDALLARADSVSAWSVGQQLQHVGLAGSAVVGRINDLADHPNQPPGGRPTFPGWFHLLTGWIPRGRVRAAAEICPSSDDPAAARQAVERWRVALAGLPARNAAIAAARGTRAHPALGHLTAGRWVRFLFNHQRHHLELVDEIRNSAKRPS